MKHPLIFRVAPVVVFLCLLGITACARRGAGYDFVPTAVNPPAQADTPPELTLQRYFDLQQQQPPLRDYRVDVEIDAALPSMKRQGQLHATRVLSQEGELSYQGAQFSGDDSIKTDVIARYLNAEREALRRPLNVGLNSENYEFAYRGVADYLDRRAHVYEVIPRQRRVGLYHGELWLDQETGNPLREYGRFVKNPSVFLSDVDFVRDYHLQDGRSLPARLITAIETRLVGTADVTIHYSNYEFGEPKTEAGQTAASGPRS